MLIKISSPAISAVINTMGAELTSLADTAGTEYLWQGNAKYWSGQAPVLFPVVGRLKDKKIIINGGEYTMDAHGFARSSEFEVAEQSESKVVLSLKSSEDTKKMYPFDFEFLVTFEIVDKTLENRFEVINLTDGQMVYGVGGHPGFNVPLFDNERFEDYLIVFEKNETINRLYFDQEKGEIDFGRRTNVITNGNILPLNWDLFENDAIIMDEPKSKFVSLIHKETGHGVKMSFEDFPYFAMWTGVGAPYLCLEPWQGIGACADETSEITDKRSMLTLEKNDHRSHSFFVTVV